MSVLDAPIAHGEQSISRTFTILTDPARRCKARWLARPTQIWPIRPPCVDLDRWCIVVAVNVLDIVCRVFVQRSRMQRGPFEVTQDSVRATIGDVAERAGVSIATVSRVVNGRLPQAAFPLPLSIVNMRPFFRAPPSELQDAAAIDLHATRNRHRSGARLHDPVDGAGADLPRVRRTPDRERPHGWSGQGVNETR